MIRSLYTAATGMKANQLYIDNIANNLSNVNTPGFKKSKLEFQDLLYQNMIEPGASPEDGIRSPSGLQVGLGVRSVANQKVFAQGSLLGTKNPFDIAISGHGFYQVQMPDGNIGYSRDGSFKISADGTLVTSHGYAMDPPIVVPEGVTEVSIDESGLVSVLMGDSEGYETVGQIELAKFINEGGLKSIGNNIYMPTDGSGQAEIGIPGQNGIGTLAQGFQEQSNVEMVEEMIGMVVAQRAYEISAKAIQTSEEMLKIANGLRG